MGAKQEFLKKVKAGTIAGKDIILFISAIQEVADDNNDLKEMLQDMKEEGESFKLNFLLPDTKRTASLKVEDGHLTASKSLLSDPQITVFMNEPVAIEILKGKIGVVEAFRQGKIKAEGQLSKAAALGFLLNIAGDELGVL
jgi:alkyl sulfatase BDS1-like metallo-beta-lactamase superfamily hydrolase